MTATAQCPCELCGKTTTMLGTRRCDRCWELEGRIKRDPALARRILAATAGGAEPVAWMRAGANLFNGFEACHKDDTNAFPVYDAPVPPGGSLSEDSND